MDRAATDRSTAPWPQGHGHRVSGGAVSRPAGDGSGARRVFVLAADPVDGARLVRAVTSCGLVATAAFQPAHARAWLPFLDVDLVVVDHPDLTGPAELDGLRTMSGAPVLALGMVATGTRGDEVIVLDRDTAWLTLRSEVLRQLSLPPGGAGPGSSQEHLAPVSAAGITLSAVQAELEVDGRRLAITPRQWRLLRPLLLAQGAVVPVSRLAAALGHDHYPVTAVEAALVRLAGRFRALGPAAVPPAIERVAGGYRLVRAEAARGCSSDVVVLAPAHPG